MGVRYSLIRPAVLAVQRIERSKFLSGVYHSSRIANTFVVGTVGTVAGVQNHWGWWLAFGVATLIAIAITYLAEGSAVVAVEEISGEYRFSTIARLELSTLLQQVMMVMELPSPQRKAKVEVVITAALHLIGNQLRRRMKLDASDLSCAWMRPSGTQLIEVSVEPGARTLFTSPFEQESHAPPINAWLRGTTCLASGDDYRALYGERTRFSCALYVPVFHNPSSPAVGVVGVHATRPVLQASHDEQIADLAHLIGALEMILKHRGTIGIRADGE